MVICLEQDADLHMVQLMPLPLTVSCFSKMQIGFTFLVPAHLVVPDKGPLNGCVCVCVYTSHTKGTETFRDSSDNTVEENSSIFSLTRMQGKWAVKLCTKKSSSS